MPLLPALAAIIGIGLKCTNDEAPGLQKVIWQCDTDFSPQEISEWTNQYKELPHSTRRVLERYDSKLWSQLDDYSKFCPSKRHHEARLTKRGNQMIYQRFTAPAALEMTNIFCHQQHVRCQKERYGNEQLHCIMHTCSRVHPLYGVILKGLDKMHQGCLVGKIPGWNERDRKKRIKTKK